MWERRLLAEAIADDIGLELESQMREFIYDAVYKSLEQTEERCKIFFHGQLEEKRSIKEIKEHHGHMEDYLLQSFRQRNVDLSRQLSESDATTEPHVRVIRQNATMLKENLNLEGTLLLDRLMENDVLSETGRKSILSRQIPIAQNCAFLDHVTKTFDEASFKTVFLPALQVEHGPLWNKLQKDLDLPNASFPAVRQCDSCEVKSKISIRKFANRLHNSGIIDEALCSDLVVSDRPQDERWNIIVKKLRKNDRAVMSVLRMFNEQFYQMLKTTNSSLFVCTCDELETLKSDVTDTEDNRSGEPEVARKSDFFEVDSLSYPTFNIDRRQNFTGMMNAPPQFICSDRDTSSPSLSPALNDKGTEENIPYVYDEIKARDCWQTLGFIYDPTDIRHLRRKRKAVNMNMIEIAKEAPFPSTSRFSPMSSQSKWRRFEVEDHQSKIVPDTIKAPFKTTRSFSPMPSPSHWPRFIPEFEVDDHQSKVVPDTIKAPFKTTRSFSPMPSPSHWPRFIPEFEVEDHQPKVVPDTIKAPFKTTRSFSPMPSPSHWPRFIPEIEVDDHQPKVVPDTIKAPFITARSFLPISSPSHWRRFIPEFEGDYPGWKRILDHSLKDNKSFKPREEDIRY